MGSAFHRRTVVGQALRITVSAVVLFGLTGCAMRMGNKTMVRDRFDYSGAIARSWKEQMLLNMVKLRYAEPPVFLDVAQVVTTYTFEESASINATDWAGAASGAAGGIAGRWAESPTITFNPMTGEKFIKSLMRPVSPVSLLSLVEAGWPIDTVFSVGVRSAMDCMPLLEWPRWGTHGTKISTRFWAYFATCRYPGRSDCEWSRKRERRAP